ncbi:MAG: cell division protein FtsQ/DivIB [Eubacterium sp.]
MKKKKSKKAIENKRELPSDIDLGDLGLEPPKIYRQQSNQQHKKNSNEQHKKRSSSSRNLTRTEKRQIETKKRKKKNALRKALIWLIVIVSFAAVGTVLSLTVFFDINTISVSGSKIYKNDEILAQCTIDVGENLFLADTDKASKTLEQNLPYVYEAKIERKLPATIEITITDAKAAFSIKNDDKTYILLDDNFKVLEKSAEKSSGIKISKASIKTANPGYTIEFEDADVGECLNKLATSVKENNFTEITSIYSNNISDNYVVYDGRIKFKLGNCDNLDNKIYKGLAACEKLNSSSPNAKGTMTIDGGKSIYFTEE